MDCPKCGGGTSVTDSVTDGLAVYRRRKCFDCNHIFFTTEVDTRISKRDFNVLKNQKQAESKNRRRKDP